MACARRERVKEIQMWSIIRELFSYLAFLILISLIVYSNQQANSFVQVRHLRRYFLNTRQIDQSYLKVRLFFLVEFVVFERD